MTVRAPGILILAVGLASHAPADTLTGLEKVQDLVADSTVLLTSQIECPPGKIAVGGGASFGNTAPLLLQSGPDGDPPTGWLSLARDESPPASWQLVSSLWCADPPPGFERVGLVTDFVAGSQKSLGVSCPAGKKRLSGGASIFGDPVGKRLVEAYPTPDGYFARAESEAGTAWLLRVDVLCANVGEVLTIEAETFFTSSGTLLGLRCPEEMVAIGGGARSEDSVKLRGSRPSRGSGAEPREWVTSIDHASGANATTLTLCVLDAAIFEDGFESGGTFAWSPTVR